MATGMSMARWRCVLEEVGWKRLQKWKRRGGKEEGRGRGRGGEEEGKESEEHG